MLGQKMQSMVERLVFGTEAGRFSFIFDSKNEIEKLKEISGLEIEISSVS